MSLQQFLFQIKLSLGKCNNFYNGAKRRKKYKGEKRKVKWAKVNA